MMIVMYRKFAFVFIETDQLQMNFMKFININFVFVNYIDSWVGGNGQLIIPGIN